MTRFRFYLGTHEPSWLARVDAPLFISHRRLRRLRRMPRAKGSWALDSGGFSELSLHGRWTVSAREYATAVQRYAQEIGGLEWVAPQDWMCEPWITEKTGRSVEWHQAATIASVLELREMLPDVRVVPVLQGWLPADYQRHVEAYARAGVPLATEPLVGLGSVCRRQGSAEIAGLVRALAEGHSLRLHGFGVKSRGLEAVHAWLTTADSMAWSYAARRQPPLPGHRHQSCANCMDYALAWRGRLLDSLRPAAQQELFAA